MHWAAAALILSGWCTPAICASSVIFSGYDGTEWGLWRAAPGEVATKLRSGEMRSPVTAAGVLAYSDPAGRIWTAPTATNGPATQVEGLPSPCGQPSLSPDAETLVVACFRFSNRQDDGALWRVDLVSGAATMIYDGPGLQKSPTFSPDGSRIAFVSGFRLSAERVIEHVWVINRDGSNPRSVAEKSDVNIDPAWDGPDALVLRSDQGGQPDLWRADLTSGTMTKLELTVRDAMEVSVSDTGEIAFVGYLNGVVGLWMLKRDGTSPVPLAVTPQDGLQAANDPYWSTDF